jgi:cytochrome c oxidase assembly protein subunit 15
MGSFRLSPAAYRRITAAAFAALAGIVVTGGAVRLTGSGLGCSDWPACERDRFVAPFEYHAMVEFVNRAITGLVSVAVILAVLGSLRRDPRRRDLTLLSLGLVAGVIAQIVLGGITVLFDLAPPLVMAHFALSMALLANAAVLHHRAGQPDGPAVPIVEPEVHRLGRLLVGAAALVLVTGTVVTGSGPHGGDEDIERLPFFVPEVARIHGISVTLFLVGVLLMLWLLRRTGAPASVSRQARVLLAVVVAQAVVGYTQYFTGVPVLLVGVHIAGAVAVWTATLVLLLHLTERPEGEPPEASAPRRARTALPV